MGQQESVLSQQIEHIKFHPEKISYINKLIERKVSESTSRKKYHGMPTTRMSSASTRKKKLIFTQNILPSQLPQKSCVNTTTKDKSIPLRKKTQSLNLIKHQTSLSESIFQDQVQNRTPKIPPTQNSFNRKGFLFQKYQFTQNDNKRKEPVDKQNFNPNKKIQSFKFSQYSKFKNKKLDFDKYSSERENTQILTTDQVLLFHRKNKFTQNFVDLSTTNKQIEKLSFQGKQINENLFHEKRKRTNSKSQKIQKAGRIRSEVRMKRRLSTVQRNNLMLLDLNHIDFLQSIKI